MLRYCSAVYISCVFSLLWRELCLSIYTLCLLQQTQSRTTYNKTIHQDLGPSCIYPTNSHSLPHAQPSEPQAAPSAPMQTPTRTGPKSQTLLNDDGSRIGLPRGIIVSTYYLLVTSYYYLSHSRHVDVCSDRNKNEQARS